MSAGKKIFVYSPEMEKYPYPDSCPFNTSRPGKTRSTLQSMGLYTAADQIELNPQRLPRTILEKYHDPAYLDALELANAGRFDVEWLYMGLGTADCPVFLGVYDSNNLAAGGSVAGAEAILNDQASIVFNPGGGLHHAFPSRAAGFCYINDVVLAGMTFTEAGKKVLFLDIDVHHTDGVQYAFYSRNDMMTISMHETGRHLFPGTGGVNEIGEGDGRGYAVNLPLPPGTYDEAYMKAFRAIVLPLIHAFGPDVLMLEIGADTLAGDPLAHLSLTNNTYVEIINFLLAFGKPILATGGGGYNIDNTVRAWALCWLALCGREGGPDAMAGMGGVMLETTEWQGGAGLRDRVLVVDQSQKNLVDHEVDEVIEQIKSTVFPIHGI